MFVNNFPMKFSKEIVSKLFTFLYLNNSQENFKRNRQMLFDHLSTINFKLLLHLCNELI